MKTLCVALVVLSLTSVCLPAPLACDKLLKRADKSPSLSGRWYIIAVTSNVCLIPALTYALLWPSAVMDSVPTDTPKLYESNITVKMYGYCKSKQESFIFENNTIFEVDSNNLPTGDPKVLLQTSCPDCQVVKGHVEVGILLLLSRRKKVTADELKEFEAQADCLGWSKPLGLNTDHDYGNCKSFDDNNIDTSALYNMMFQRLKETYTVPLSCSSDKYFQFPNATFESIESFQEVWKSYWDTVVQDISS